MAKITILSDEITEDPAPYWRAFARILVRGRLRRMGLLPMPAELMQDQEEDEKTGRWAGEAKRYRQQEWWKILTTVDHKLTTAEEKILKIIREMKYGEVIIKIKDGKPTTIEEKRTEKLD